MVKVTYTQLKHVHTKAVCACVQEAVIFDKEVSF